MKRNNLFLIMIALEINNLSCKLTNRKMDALGPAKFEIRICFHSRCIVFHAQRYPKGTPKVTQSYPKLPKCRLNVTFFS